LKAHSAFRFLIFSAFLIGQTNPGVVLAQSSSSANLDGFTPEGSAAERRWEEEFRAVPAPGSAREHLRRLTAVPHVAGTKEDYATAIYVRDQIRSYGISSELKEYEVLLPYPKQPGIVELMSPRRERLTAKEGVIAQDPSSSNPNIIPLFSGYSPSGDVTAPLV
jgi:N-acetylated-alpha-linked acidic dipeptidase